MEEETDQIRRDWETVVKANLSFFVFLGIGVALFLAGAYFFFQERLSGPSVSFSSHEATSSGAISSLKVDVEGAVIRPGVYELPADARLQDGIVAAGGLSSVADREFVSKNINLAAKVNDGAKIYIPRKNEPPFVPTFVGTTEGQAAIININTASESELDKLYGVGVATAQKIISGRPYSKIEDLVSKKVLGQSAFDKIKDKITIY